jgi:hypothetical protein
MIIVVAPGEQDRDCHHWSRLSGRNTFSMKHSLAMTHNIAADWQLIV